MTRRAPYRTSLAVAALCLAAALAVRVAGQTPVPFPGLLDEHPAIQYGLRPPTDKVARLNAALAGGSTRPKVGKSAAQQEIEGDIQALGSAPQD